MEEMRKVAFASVARACGFGMLAIICVMVGMSFDPRAVFQAGGILTLMMTFILILKARYALTQNYKKTEMWLYLDKNFRPPEAYAQWAASTVLRDAYFTFAMYTALISIVMWIFAFLVAASGLASRY
ncbi:MAG TPA: hypothetical protein VIG34_04720 [Xanthobacteraceae bacterium]|jgi:hypothetical protein